MAPSSGSAVPPTEPADEDPAGPHGGGGGDGGGAHLRGNVGGGRVTQVGRDPRSPLRGRADVVKDLAEVLAEVVADADRGSRVWVLHGLGGCGKTTIAIEVAHRAAALGVRVWWVRAVDQASLVGGCGPSPTMREPVSSSSGTAISG